MTTKETKNVAGISVSKNVEQPVEIENTNKKNNQMNCWLAPGFDPLKKIEQLKSQVNCPGGHIEQSNMYLDHQSAIDYSDIVKQSSYNKVQQDYPFLFAANSIYRELEIGKQKLDIIALGPGTGEKEIILTKCILDKLPQNADVGLYLLDISQPLVNLAYQSAHREFSHDKRISVQAIQGDMLAISKYDLLFRNPINNKRQRLITMLGYTFANLDNELQFLKNDLSVFSKGDLLIIDAGLAFDTPENIEAIRAKDPYLNKKQPWMGPVIEFLSGPIKRYKKNNDELNFQFHLDTESSVVPGSYIVEARVTSKLEDGMTQDLSVFRFKRYDADKLIKSIANTGVWDYVHGEKFGVGHGMLLYLFVRK